MPIAAHSRYYLGFNLVPGIGPVRLNQLIERCGSVEAAWNATPSKMAESGLTAKNIAALRDAQRNIDLDAEIERIIEADTDIVTIEDGEYPRLLTNTNDPPPLLYVRGALSSLDEWALAVVGTRSPTVYGKEATRRLIADLAERGVTIVSGLARGIDSIAHETALDAGGRTIAILGSGVDVIYPERNHNLVTRILEQGQGAIISELPLGTSPAPANFPPRNRIISGLSLATLVVEAGAKSGALITVGFALEQGREVFAVPGSILSKASEGTNQLIRRGAGVVTKADDLIEALNLETAVVQQEMRLEIPADAIESAVLSIVSYEPQHIDELGRACGMTASEVSATLAMLELKGLVRQAGAMQYVLAR